MEVFLPPLPPIFINGEVVANNDVDNNEKDEIIKIEPGKFEYIKNTSNREMLCTAYKAINITENWEFIKNMKKLWVSSVEMDKIYKEIEKQGYYGHSGCSFMGTMRDMQSIALYGEEKFKANYEAYEKKTCTNRAIIERREITNHLLSS